MARDRIRQESLEVIEDTIEDFEYLYEEEEEFLRNRNVILRYKIFGFLVSLLFLFFLIMGTGVATMVSYGTDKVVNKELRDKNEYLTQIEPFYSDIINYVIMSENKDENGVVTGITFGGELGNYYEKLYKDQEIKLEANNGDRTLTNFQDKIKKDYGLENLDKAINDVKAIKEVDEGKYKSFTSDIISTLSVIKKVNDTVLKQNANDPLLWIEVEQNLKTYNSKVNKLISDYKHLKEDFKSVKEVK